MRLLLVDDDEGLRALLRTTFEAVDVEVDEAVDAHSAQRRIADARPDAIVLDVSMPGMSGVELCARLKGARATRDIPIVLLTGSDVANELIAQSGRQFDPAVVEAFRSRERTLRTLKRKLSAEGPRRRAPLLPLA